MIRSCTRPAVSTDMKAAWLVVRPLPVQGVGRRPVRGDDPDRGSIPRTVRIRPVHSRWYGAGHYAFVAQWIGRPPPERKAAGSSPAEGAQGTPPVGREEHDGHRTHVSGPHGIHPVVAQQAFAGGRNGGRCPSHPGRRVASSEWVDAQTGI